MHHLCRRLVTREGVRLEVGDMAVYEDSVLCHYFGVNRKMLKRYIHQRERSMRAKRKTQTIPNQRVSSVLGAAKGFLEGALWATRCGGWSREEQSQQTSRICLLLHPHLSCQSRPASTTGVLPKLWLKKVVLLVVF